MSRPAHQAPVRFAVQPTSHGRFRVVNTAGDVFGTFGNEETAQAHADALQDRHRAAGQIRKRPCLTCGETFTSAGIHNRLCPSCNQSARGLGREYVGV